MSYDEMIDEMALNDFAAVESDDAVKRELELTCLRCAHVICDVEPGDSLGLLIRTVADHVCPSERGGSMVP